jgi:capsular polysaccharide transport system permease protein
MTEVVFNANSGITSIRVRAFTPADAQAIVQELLALGEQTVNSMNTRVLADGVRIASLEVSRAEERVAAAQAALSEFRARELTLDPQRGSVLATELIGRLNGELAAARAQLAELRAISPTTPAIPSLQGRIAALTTQIGEERERAVSGPEGLTRQLGTFDRLNLEREFANRLLTGALQGLQAARLEAQRQQLFIERVTEPTRIDYAGYPQVTRWVLTNMMLNLVAVMIGWLLFVGAREHQRGLAVRRRA